MRLSLPSFPDTSVPSEDIKQQLLAWATVHRRDRIFAKDEKIPTRPGLVYFVESGVARLEGRVLRAFFPQIPLESSIIDDSDQGEMFLGIIESGHPFYWESSRSIGIDAYAHCDDTHVFWLYWSELSEWEGLADRVGRSILRQHQHYLGWLSLFGQKRMSDRLLGFLTLLTQEYGIPTEEGLYFPYLLTHAQIGRAIGANRVTVTRLLGRLRHAGAIAFYEDQFLCLPFVSSPKKS